jgi:enoyl-CoA hydratase
MGDLVSYRLAEGVATIVMDDGKANALSPAMIAAVNGALDRATSDGAVVILTGRTGIFSGGFDLTTLRAGGPDAAQMLEQGFRLALRLLEHPAPVIIACNGHAVAMGVFLLLSGDYLIGADGPFRLVANEVAIGLTITFTAIELCRQRLAPSHFIRVVGLAEIYAPVDAVAAGLAKLDRAAHASTKARARHSTINAVQSALTMDAQIFADVAAPRPDAEPSSS